MWTFNSNQTVSSPKRIHHDCSPPDRPIAHVLRRARRLLAWSFHSVGFRLLLLLTLAGLLTCDWITGPENQPPLASATIPDQIVEVDSTVLVDLVAHFADPDGDTLTYTAVSTAPATAAATVSGSLLAVTGVAAGQTSMTVTAQDPEGLMASQSFAVTVPNRAPLVADTIADGEVYVDGTLVIDVAAYFTDPDGDDLEYSATSSDATRAAVALSKSTLTVTGLAVGSTGVTVKARDPGGLAAEQSFAVTVPNRAPEAVGRIEDRELEVDSVLTVDVAPYFTDPDRDSLEYLAAGQSFAVTVPNRSPEPVGTIADRELYVGDAVEIDVAAHFTDPDRDELEYAVASSDTARVAVGVSGGMVTVAGAAVGNATVTVTARDPEGLSAEQAFAVEVPNRSPEPLGTIADRDVYVGDTVAVDIAAYFAEPDGEELEYAAASASAATATVAVSGSTLTVTAVAVGSTTVTVTAQDPHGLWAEQSFAVTVPNRAPGRVGRIADREVKVDSVVVMDVAARFTEPDGEELEYSATSSDITRVVVAMSGSRLTVTGVAKGTATVTVTAVDPGGLAAEQNFEVSVPNRAPEAVGTIADRVVRAGNSATVDVAAHFTDPDGDALRYFATSSDPARVSVSVSGSVVTVTGVAGGSATVTITARDSAGLSARQRFFVTVPNRAPEAVGAIGNRAVERNKSFSLDVSPYFSDPDGDDLAHSATSSKHGEGHCQPVRQYRHHHGRRRGYRDHHGDRHRPGGSLGYPELPREGGAGEPNAAAGGHDSRFLVFGRKHPLGERVAVLLRCRRGRPDIQRELVEPRGRDCVGFGHHPHRFRRR